MFSKIGFHFLLVSLLCNIHGAYHFIQFLYPYRTKVKSFQTILLRTSLQRLSVLWNQDPLLDRCISLWKNNYFKFVIISVYLSLMVLSFNIVIRVLLRKKGLISRETSFPLQLKLHENLLLLLWAIAFLIVIGWLTGIKQGIIFV